MNARDLEILSPEARLSEFERLGARYYETPRFGAQFAREAGVATRTITHWRKHPEKLPAWTILLLASWAQQTTTPEQISRSIARVADDLALVATQMNKVALLCRRQLDEVTGYRPHAPGEPADAPQGADDGQPDHESEQEPALHKA